MEIFGEFSVTNQFSNYADEHVQQMQKTLANLCESDYAARVDGFHQLQSAQESRNLAEVSLYLRIRCCPFWEKGRKRANMRCMKILNWEESFLFAREGGEDWDSSYSSNCKLYWTVEKNEKRDNHINLKKWWLLNF